MGHKVEGVRPSCLALSRASLAFGNGRDELPFASGVRERESRTENLALGRVLHWAWHPSRGLRRAVLLEESRIPLGKGLVALPLLA